MSASTASPDLTQAAKGWAKAAGAMLVGIASIERFDSAATVL